MSELKPITKVIIDLEANLDNIANEIDRLPFVKNFLRDGLDVQFTDDFIVIANLCYTLKLIESFITIQETIRLISNK